jgi:hypothetical protein
VLILGRTSDDKGTQLETLVRTILEGQGYVRVRCNLVGSGGNELDVVAERESVVMDDVQLTPVMCEAKAYANPVDMPVWQRFLGKLFLERARDTNTVGLLVALNGVNGNVAGSYRDLRRADTAVFVFEGSTLIEQARESGQVAPEDIVRELARTRTHRDPQRVEPGYYRGGWYWVLFGDDDYYSITDGLGELLSADAVESLRPALENSVTGTLLAADEVRAAAEARHATRLRLMHVLFRGDVVVPSEWPAERDVIAALTEEPFCVVDQDGSVRLLPPEQLGAPAVSRLFLSLFDNVLPVSLLGFAVEGLHVPYVLRLIEVMPEIQSGFRLESEDVGTLEAVAPMFPSVWAVLASELPMITTHRKDQLDVGDAADVSDRNAFWEAVTVAVRRDYGTPGLSGFLYDLMNVAEMEQRVELLIKSKTGPIGAPIVTSTRDAVKQWGGEVEGEQGDQPVYVLVRILPHVAEPWEEGHPEPAFKLSAPEPSAEPTDQTT